MKNCVTGTFDTPQAIVLRGETDMNNDELYIAFVQMEVSTTWSSLVILATL